MQLKERQSSGSKLNLRPKAKAPGTRRPLEVLYETQLLSSTTCK